MNEFNALLSQMIDYIADHGFDHSPRMQQMMSLLRKAADNAFVSESQLQQQMKSSLESYFKKSLTATRLRMANKGVERVTVDRIMPSLRAELDRRIMANADMIRLNREQAIDKTLQRFSGWASSVPVGGSRAINSAEVKQDIGKTAKQLRYEVRRREIDQGHKLMSVVDAVIAQQGNAIAMKWQSHWRQPGYDYRPDHKERDGKIYAIRGSWAMDRGLINKGDGYSDEITAPAEEVFCRCNGVYLYNLRDLPDDMLTAKGKAELEQVRMNHAS